MVLRLFPSRILAPLHSRRDHGMIMAVADDVQLDFLILSSKCSFEVVPGVSLDLATFAILMLSGFAGSAHPIKVINRAAVIAMGMVSIHWARRTYDVTHMSG